MVSIRTYSTVLRTDKYSYKDLRFLSVVRTDTYSIVPRIPYRHPAVGREMKAKTAFTD